MVASAVAVDDVGEAVVSETSVRAIVIDGKSVFVTVDVFFATSVVDGSDVVRLIGVDAEGDIAMLVKEVEVSGKMLIKANLLFTTTNPPNKPIRHKTIMQIIANNQILREIDGFDRVGEISELESENSFFSLERERLFPGKTGVLCSSLLLA